jgi:PKD repeat protein
MKKIFSTLFLLISIVSYSQISIVTADMPRQNDTMRFSIATNGITANQAAKSGVDTIWDFTNLKPNSQDIEKFFAPSATPYALQFGILNASTYGIKDDALNALGGLGGAAGFNIENVFAFYKNSTTANVLTGRGLTISSIPLALNLNPRDTVFKFPLNFRDVDTTYFSGSTTIPGIGGISIQGRRINNVDGWGTVKTPYGEFSCIRIKTTITETDTISITTIKLPIPNNRIIYTWYAKNLRYPVLEITQTTGLAGALTIKYKDIYRPEAFASNARFNASRTNVSQFDTVNLVNLSTGTPNSFAWTITPNTFRYVGGTKATDNNPRVLFDKSGTYSVKLRVVYDGGADDTLRNNYINVLTTSMNEISLNNFNLALYPNPAKNNIFVESSVDNNNSVIELFDILGKKFHTIDFDKISNNKLEINISNLNKGIYFIKFTTENNVSKTEKFIVE